ncbi:hypothetical protein [Clostridium botulinum]|uniref:hypothetical protein n=1 Tax=Clostridium botulinum TaxID=1491 RepID=UPI0019687DC9|nr:hypothetical protein [Clostridium botulinum]
MGENKKCTNIEEIDFIEILHEELKSNFTELEIQQLLKVLPKEKNNLIIMLNKEKQDVV